MIWNLLAGVTLYMDSDQKILNEEYSVLFLYIVPTHFPEKPSLNLKFVSNTLLHYKLRVLSITDAGRVERVQPECDRVIARNKQRNKNTTIVIFTRIIRIS